ELHDKAFGVTAPLVTKADGGKFGKTESGAVWLSAPRTTPYAMYQFWLNANDDDVIRFLKLFTLTSKERVEELEAAHRTNPGAREAHRALAHDATTLVHGEAEAIAAANAARALFSGDVRALPAHLVTEVFADVPASEHAKASLEGPGVDLVDCLVETGLATSKRQAREFVQNGSVSINGDKAEEGRTLTSDDLLHGSVIAIRRGKKNWHLTKWA
ncbi:MAG: tyrosine--tRNA ligase, partial [Phycisphaerales bacterium]|nr:tyrosine--tRNA ligase [Phycisphaerales bacterium]